MAKPNQAVIEKEYGDFIHHITLALVVAEFNSHITEKLLQGASGYLGSMGMTSEQQFVVRVPGAFEIPKACDWICKKGEADGIITLGAVIQGETRHFDYVCSESARGIMDLNLRYNIPISYGILTCNNDEQALSRAGGKNGNKGNDAARAVLDMIRLKRTIG